MGRIVGALLVGLMFAAAPLMASAEEDKSTPYSYYLISCGTFIHHRESGTPTDIHNTADIFYVAGWISAYNRLSASSAIPEDTTLDDVMLWLEEYCTDHPLSNVETGLFALSEEVKPRSGGAAAPDKPQAPASTPAPQQPKQPSSPSPFHAPVHGLTPLPY
jgi:hypothetical protein